MVNHQIEEGRLYCEGYQKTKENYELNMIYQGLSLNTMAVGCIPFDFSYTSIRFVDHTESIHVPGILSRSKILHQLLHLEREFEVKNHICGKQAIYSELRRMEMLLETIFDFCRLKQSATEGRADALRYELEMLGDNHD